MIQQDYYISAVDQVVDLTRKLEAMESLNATLEATLQDNDMTGILSVDCVSHTAAILAAADMLADKLDSIDRSIFELEMALT